MDSIVGLTYTLYEYDRKWATVHRMEKSPHFIPFKISYMAKDYSKLYFRDMVRFHGVPFYLTLIDVMSLLFCFGSLSKMFFARKLSLGQPFTLKLMGKHNE